MARSGKQKRVVFTPIRGYLVAVKMEIPARPWNESRIQRDSKIFLLSRADGWTREKERERRQATRDEGRNKRWLKKSNRKRVCIRVCVYRLLFRDTRRNLIARKQREREREREREKRRGENARHGRMKVSRRVTYLLSSPSVKYYEGDSVIGTARVSTIFERTY